MSLTDIYQRQFAWRDWDSALARCPIRPGQRVLDLGCGPGDLTRLLAARGCRVTGVDANPELIAAAQAAQIAQAEFLCADLRSVEPGTGFDGLWCSFAAAYFPADFGAQLARWLAFLAPQAWICLVEVDDLFGHRPLKAATSARLAAFYDEALQVGRYDFLMGRRLAPILAAAGLDVQSLDLQDQELCFAGPAQAEVQVAWEQRLGRLLGLQHFLGQDFTAFKQEFLQTLSSPEHVSQTRVICCVGRR